MRDVRVRQRRDSPRGRLHCNTYASLQSVRAGRKAHYGRPAKATGRLARRRGTAGPGGRPARRARRHRAASRPSRRPAPTEGRTGPRARTPGPDHRPTNPAIAGPVVQHRPPSQAAQCGGARRHHGGSRQTGAGRSDHQRLRGRRWRPRRRRRRRRRGGDVRHGRDGPRGKLHCAYKAHYALGRIPAFIGNQ